MKDNKPETMKIDDVEYVRKDSISGTNPALNPDGLPYVVIRSLESGCHAGYLEKKEGANVTLRNSRRLWYWEGAATLSQLAAEGVKTPNNCKFPCELDKIEILNVCEVIYATEKAKKSIKQVPVWQI